MASKAQIIDDVKSNLPLPDQPPAASDWNSADARITNNDPDAKREVDRTDDALRDAGTSLGGREEKDGLKGLPDDAVAREKKGREGLEPTTK